MGGPQGIPAGGQLVLHSESKDLLRFLAIKITCDTHRAVLQVSATIGEFEDNEELITGVEV